MYVNWFLSIQVLLWLYKPLVCVCDVEPEDRPSVREEHLKAIHYEIQLLTNDEVMMMIEGGGGVFQYVSITMRRIKLMICSTLASPRPHTARNCLSTATPILT